MPPDTIEIIPGLGRDIDYTDQPKVGKMVQVSLALDEDADPARESWIRMIGLYSEIELLNSRAS